MFMLNWNGRDGLAANEGFSWHLNEPPQLEFEFLTLSYAMGAGSKTTHRKTSNNSEVKDEQQPLTLIETKAIEMWLLESQPKDKSEAT